MSNLEAQQASLIQSHRCLCITSTLSGAAAASWMRSLSCVAVNDLQLGIYYKMARKTGVHSLVEHLIRHGVKGSVLQHVAACRC